MRMAPTPGARSCSSATSTAAACSPRSRDLELLHAEERELVAGFVINKFRGDASQLGAGIDDPERAHRRPDARRGAHARGGAATTRIALDIEAATAGRRPTRRSRIAVVRLPFISNFTDFDALAAEPDVDVRFATRRRSWRAPRRSCCPAPRARSPTSPGCGSAVLRRRCGRRPPPARRWSVSAAATRCSAAASSTPSASSRPSRRWRASGCSTPRRPSPPTSGPSAPRASCSGRPPLRAARPRPARSARRHTRARLRDPHGPHRARARRRAAAAAARRRRRGRDDGAAAAGPVCGAYLHGLFDHPELRAAFLNACARGLGLPPAPPRRRPTTSIAWPTTSRRTSTRPARSHRRTLSRRGAAPRTAPVNSYRERRACSAQWRAGHMRSSPGRRPESAGLPQLTTAASVDSFSQPR